jgi:hypothetical protein
MTIADLPEFIIVELELGEYIIARRLSNELPPTYRRFLICAGQPAAVFTQEALARESDVAADLQAFAASQAGGSIREGLAAARVRIEQDEEGRMAAHNADPT